MLRKAYLRVLAAGCISVPLVGCHQDAAVGISDPVVYTTAHIVLAQKSYAAAVSGDATLAQGRAHQLSTLADMQRYFAAKSTDYDTSKLRMDTLLDNQQRSESFARVLIQALSVRAGIGSGVAAPTTNSASPPAGTDPTTLSTADATALGAALTATVSDSPFDQLERARTFYTSYVIALLRLFGTDSRAIDADAIDPVGAISARPVQPFEAKAIRHARREIEAAKELANTLADNPDSLKDADPDRSLRDLQVAKQALDDSLKASQASLPKLQDSLKAFEVQVRQAQRALRDARDQRHPDHDVIEAAQQNLADKKAQRDAAEKKIVATQADIKAKPAEIKAKTDEVAAKQGVINKAEEALANNLTSLETKIKAAHDELDKAQNRQPQVMTAIWAAKTRLNDLLDQRDKETGVKVQEERGQVAYDMFTAIKALKDDATKAKTAADDAKKTATTKASDLLTAQAKLTNMTQEVTAVQADLERTTKAEEREVLRSRIREQQDAITKATQAITDTTKKASDDAAKAVTTANDASASAQAKIGSANADLNTYVWRDAVAACRKGVEQDWLGRAAIGQNRVISHLDEESSDPKNANNTELHKKNTELRKQAVDLRDTAISQLLEVPDGLDHEAAPWKASMSDLYEIYVGPQQQRLILLIFQAHVEPGNKADQVAGLKVTMTDTNVKVLYLTPTRTYDVASEDTINNQETAISAAIAATIPGKGAVEVDADRRQRNEERRKYLSRMSKMASFARAGKACTEFGWYFYPTNIVTEKNWLGVYTSRGYLEGGGRDCCAWLLVPASKEKIELNVRQELGSTSWDWYDPTRWRQYHKVCDSVRNIIVTLPPISPLESTATGSGQPGMLSAGAGIFLPASPAAPEIQPATAVR